jgi:hypothetical protein
MENRFRCCSQRTGDPAPVRDSVDRCLDFPLLAGILAFECEAAWPKDSNLPPPGYKGSLAPNQRRKL